MGPNQTYKLLHSKENQKKEKKKKRSSCCSTVEVNPISIHEDAGSIPALLSGLRIWHCRELWCR